MERQITLAPCPFCGGVDLSLEYDEDELNDSMEYYVYCGQCTTTGPEDERWEWAVEKWNKRTEAEKGEWCIINLTRESEWVIGN